MTDQDAGQPKRDLGRDPEREDALFLLWAFLDVHARNPHVAVATADAFLEVTAPESPSVAPFVAESQSDCDWWADCASGTHVAAMLVACLNRLARRQMIMAINARKRAMVAIWNSMDPEDRAAFLRFAQPESEVAA